MGKTSTGQYFFFAWGPYYPYQDHVPEKDILDGESGIQFFTTAELALKTMKEAVKAAKNI